MSDSDLISTPTSKIFPKLNQGQLIWVSFGKIFDVGVDMRSESDTYKQYFSVELSAENTKQIYMPLGFAHGFCTLEDNTLFHYKCTDYYSPQTERGIAWNDPALNIPWPVKHPVLSPKDHHYPSIKEVPHEHLFT